MGLLDWLWSRRYERLPTRVFLTEQAKWTAIGRDVLHCRQDAALVIVTAHFPATYHTAAATLQGRAVDYEELTGHLDHNRLDRLIARSGPAPVVLALAELLDDGERLVAEETGTSVAILAVERHPLYEHDERIEKFARNLSYPCRLADYVSLQDALMRQFVGHQIAQTLRALGMEESDSIDSALVTRRIRAAQQKIRNRAIGDEQTESPEEWLRRNCPDLAARQE